MVERYLITAVPQVDGDQRRIYAASRRDQREAREILRDDPAMIDYLGGLVSSVEDVARA